MNIASGKAISPASRFVWLERVKGVIAAEQPPYFSIFLQHRADRQGLKLHLKRMAKSPH
jgi:hypothetical protein